MRRACGSRAHLAKSIRPSNAATDTRRLPRRASKFPRATRGRRPGSAGGSSRFERLEARFLLSVAPAADGDVWFNANVSPVTGDPAGIYAQDLHDLTASQPGVFRGDTETQTALFHFTFDGTPQVQQLDHGAIVTLEGEESWLAAGDPVVPVRQSTILLPQGMQIASVSVSYLDAGTVLTGGVPLLAAPAALPFAGFDGASDDWTSVVSTSFPGPDVVEYSNHVVCGYQVGTLRIFPAQYDADADALIYHSEISATVTVVPVERDAGVPVRSSQADRQRVAQLVDNPEALDDYTVPAASSAGDASLLPTAGPYDYVIITSGALAGSFQPLIDQKISRGLSAGIVTTDYICANYSGTEVHDNADRIRQFIAEAYRNWGTQWVLLGGDTEVVPQRGVYASVGSTVDNDLPTDMYYACLDGSWNGDRDSLWGESHDGPGGGDVDLVPDVSIGRAPVSTVNEAVNFVSKTVRYETTPHPNATTAVWLGEQLDDSTWGSYSSIPIRRQTLPLDWDVTERYDSAGGWSGSDFRNDLNASPHLVNHLGHSNETYNARLTNGAVAGLSNAYPYLMYSQGCMAGSFDTHDLAIAEQHVVGPHGAFGVVMNSRYGWYLPGSTPGASHHYAMEFWDAIFNEGLTHLGAANQDSKDDNLFRVESTGVCRWIHFETNLFGDPETPLQTDGAPGVHGGALGGAVWDDVNADGQQQPGEDPLPGQTVFLDVNHNGRLDAGTVTAVADVGVHLADNATATSSLTVTDGATIRDLNVTLDIAHTYASDLEAYLISPSGTRVELFTRVGGWGQNFTDTILDDEARVSIADAEAPFTGTFRPEGLLSRFDGTSAVGTWTLEITDTMSWDTGTLNRWSLEITSEEPYTETGADGTYAFAGLAEGAYDVRHELPTGWRHTSPPSDVRVVSVQNGDVVQGVNFPVTQEILPPPATDLGRVDFLEIAGLNPGGTDSWYSCQTTREGYLTIEAFSREPAGSVELRMYDARLNQLAVSTLSGGAERIDWIVNAREQYYFRLSGNAGDAVLRLANLVDHQRDTLLVHGTGGADRFEFAAGNWHQVTINGVHYEFPSAVVTSLKFDGGPGEDTAVLCGSAGNDKAALYPTRGVLTGPAYQALAVNTTNVIVLGQGGTDVARLYDAAGDDLFVATPAYSRLCGNGFFNQVESFRYVHAFATAGGRDTARLFDSPGNDTFVATPGYAKLYSDRFYSRAVAFRYVHAYASTGGNDVARLYDSPGDDVFVATPTQGTLWGNTSYCRAVSFPYVCAISVAGGADVARLYDSPGNDTFVATPAYGKLFGDGFHNHAVSFRYVHAYAGAGGTDVARLYDCYGDDIFVAASTYAKLCGSGFYNRAQYFRYVHAQMGTGGYDRAYLFDSTGDDHLKASDSSIALWANDLSISVHGIASACVTSSEGGRDTKHAASVDFLLQTEGPWIDV